VLGLLVGCSPVTSLLHPSSPCPSVFSYDGAGPETDRWYGEIVVNSAEYLVGVRLNIQLDRQSHLMVVSFFYGIGLCALFEFVTKENIHLHLNGRDCPR
jgi:hypothetical protein